MSSIYDQKIDRATWCKQGQIKADANFYYTKKIFFRKNVQKTNFFEHKKNFFFFAFFFLIPVQTFK